jgi:serine/threonine-protein kinase HipA
MYGSAMTLVGKQDSEPSSYLEIAEAVERSGDPAAIKEDLAELFRRVIFNVLTANRDDHLRNHGFLRNAAGWRLAPAFDMNPAPEKFEHVLAFDDVARTPDIDVVLETAGLYRLKRGEANAIASHVKQAVTAWHEEARVLRIPSDEIERMARAFDESGP